MSKYWNPKLQALDPYIPGEQPQDRKYIKLNTNENPYPPSPLVIEAIHGAAHEDLRLYPDPECTVLRKELATYYHLTPDQVFVGNGSDEVLAFAFAAFFGSGAPLLIPEITYSFYPVYANFFNIGYQTIPLQDDFSIPVAPFMRENGGIAFANPNAPTGKYLTLDAVRQLVDYNFREAERVVLVDEAYIDFGGVSASRLIPDYPNLLTVHTFSKSRSLAGLRVGFALGQSELIQGLERIKNSFNSYTLDRLALAGATAALRDEAHFKETRSRIIKTRDWITTQLKMLEFRVIDSQANFIFISHPTIRACQLFDQLRHHGVLVRFFNKPGIDNFLRVSIGSDHEMQAFLDIITKIVKQEA